MSVLTQIAGRAASDSPLWAGALEPGGDLEPEFAGRCPDRYLLGVEMIREAYLLHYGSSRLFRQDDRELALLAGDYLYAAGLVEICRTGDLRAVADLADLIARCAAGRGDGQPLESDEALWERTVEGLGRSSAR
jgi:hypothetical protein